MSESPYLLYVNLSPKGVTEEKWRKWWISQHVPELMDSKLCSRVALYKEVGFSMLPKPNHPRKLLGVYQTDHERLQDHESFKIVSPEEDLEVRNYKLIQNYNPNGVDERSYPNMLTTEMNPLDQRDFEDWYRTDLLPRIRHLPGYKRSKRYQLAGGCENSAETFLGSDYIAIHEVEDLNKAFVSERAHIESVTPRTERHIRDSEQSRTEDGGGFVRRGWELVHADGS